jgi:hypothetical protein
LIRLDEEIKQLKHEFFRVCWFMRGGVSINDLMDRYSADDRELIYEVIKDNIETTKATQMPLL